MKRKILMKRNKAQGHLEIILSFVIFMGFLGFLFIFFNPFARTSKVSLVDSVQEKIIENVTIEIGKISAIVHSSGSCYDLSEITDDYGNDFKAVPDGARKYIVYFSDEIVFNGGGVLECGGDSDYTLSAFSKEKIVSRG
jgi:hypothetical protein